MLFTRPLGGYRSRQKSGPTSGTPRPVL